MTYNNAIDYINSFINFEKIPKYNYASSFKLERMQAIVEKLGNPHEGLKAIHVAGSKGKGSTCAITAYILRQAGYRVGLYTSPHLMDFRERIRVLDKVTGNRSQVTGNRLQDFEGTISKEEFIELIDEIRPVAERFREHKVLGKASFFEILTACAFLYFKKKQTDFVVLETGLGGRLDATNVCRSVVCGITNISLEHTDKLGNSLAKIAFEKVGIIKAQSSELRAQSLVVVSAEQEKEAGDVIRRACKKRGVGLCEIGKDITYKIHDSHMKSQIFDIKGPGYEYKDVTLNLIGNHQIQNAALSIGMLELIDNINFNISEDAIRKGLRNVIWPGRLQVIQKNPYIILDGAHCPASMRALMQSIKSLCAYKKLICVFGISSDKDITSVSYEIDKASDIIILTKAQDNLRAVEPLSLRRIFPVSRKGIYISDDVEEAIEKAHNIADKNDLILITGSLFIVGDVLKARNPSTMLGAGATRNELHEA